TDFPPSYAQDELRYRIRHELFLRPDQTTFTFRNKMDQTALPIRSWGAFMPPNGIGGGGVHWNAETWRFLPSDFVLRTHLTQRYVNSLAVRMGPCTYCGFCEWFGCANYSKSSPQTTLLPVLVRKGNFTARDNCEMTKINLDGSGKHATGVTFVDSSGQEWEQR